MTLEEYHNMVNSIQTWWETVKPLALQIAREKVGKSTDSVRLTGDVVEITYNGACNCHPETSYEEFPVELLFDPAAVEKIKIAKEADRVIRENEKQEEEIKRAKQILEEERALYESLKKKYGVKREIENK
jgi:hypothetical protein